MEKYPKHYRTEKKPKRSFWTREEIQALLKGVSRHGQGNWMEIKNDSELGSVLLNRTTVDIKDKWRNHRKDQRKKSSTSQGFGASLSADHTTLHEPRKIRSNKPRSSLMGQNIIEVDNLDCSNIKETVRSTLSKSLDAQVINSRLMGQNIIERDSMDCVSANFHTGLLMSIFVRNPSFLGDEDFSKTSVAQFPGRLMVSDLKKWVSARMFPNSNRPLTAYMLTNKGDPIDENGSLAQAGISNGDILYVEVTQRE